MNCRQKQLSFRIKDAVAATGLSRATLYKLAKRGDLQMVRVGGRTLILAEELERLLANAAELSKKAGQ